jgi:DNA invertase Pin-like site-specific DNA recombinase
MTRGNSKKVRLEGVIGYSRVSTEEQANSGLGLAAQEADIKGECERRGVPLLAFHTDAGISGKSLVRPALGEALAALDAGQGSILMVSKLDRLSRSIHDASSVMLTAEKEGWSLVALDVAVDTTTPQGAAMAHILVVFAELERKLIGKRTKDALAVKSSQGFQLGRPPSLPEEVVQRIVVARRGGASWSEISRQLNDEGVPTAQKVGALWYPATVRQVALRADGVKQNRKKGKGPNGQDASHEERGRVDGVRQPPAPDGEPH